MTSIQKYKVSNLWIVDIPDTFVFKIVPLKGINQNQFQQQYNPIAQINGSLFNNYNDPIGTVIYDGNMVKNSGKGYGVGIYEDGISFGSPWTKVWKDYISGYPGLIANGEKITWTIQDNAVFNSSTRRSAIARKGNRIYFVTTVGGMTLQKFTDTLFNLEMEDAINLDGGGSSRLYCEGECINNPTDNRKIANVIAAWENNNLEKEDEILSTKTICVDAGHGVETAGKCSPDKSYYEHEFNLYVAKRIEYHLKRHGFNVVMTRNDEHDVSLNERCKISNNAKADAFISVHTNEQSDDWGTAQGWSAHIIAKGGNAEKIAESIRSIAIPMLGVKDRGVVVSNYQVIRETDAPAVLIEHGFHTNKEELAKLKDTAYREKCAISDAKGITNFFGVTWVDETMSDTDNESSVITARSLSKQVVYDINGHIESTRYISENDVCTIGKITNNLLIEVTYPISIGTRTAYVKSLEQFI